MNQSATYTAHFQIRSYYVSVSANPSSSGTVSGGGMYDYGQTCTVHAEPAEHYGFTNWTENGASVSTDADYSFTVTGGRNLVGHFERVFEVVAYADPEAGATITGAGTYHVGDMVTLTCEPNDNYTFLNWTEDGEVVSEELAYTFDAKDCEIVAHLMYYDGVGEQANSLLVYPNPVSDKLTVKANEHIQSVEIYSLTGALIYGQKGCSNRIEIPTEDLPSGLYFIRLVTSTHNETRKFVKE